MLAMFYRDAIVRAYTLIEEGLEMIEQDHNMEYIIKVFAMNVELKNLLYKASIDPVNRKELVNEARKVLDNFYNLPTGIVVE